jgi:ribonucleoside-diphosphate reductase alpha chain
MERIYKEEEVKAAATNFFKGDELAANVWITKYALRNTKGDLLEVDPNDMFIRLTEEFSKIEKKYANPIEDKVILDLFSNWTIIPAGSVLYGIGNNYSFSSLANCFVVSNPDDSYGSILKIDEEQIQLMKRRGGVGHDLSHIRPRGSSTTNAAKTSTGVVTFMERYSNSTREVAQEGRRGR